ncbi:MAG TPA: archease [Candidatus Limnocylindrales bacterium]|nr:archease [Candidatus Limnocylindrales bacterium]
MTGRQAIRGHETLPHTADVGLRGWGSTMAVAFEEAALALGELTAEVAEAGRGGHMLDERIELAAGDLVGLAYAFLNELVGLIDLYGALRDTHLSEIGPSDDGWRLRGSARFLPYDGVGVRRRAEVKSATYHGLTVDRLDAEWTMTAYLDV